MELLLILGGIRQEKRELHMVTGSIGKWEQWAVYSFTVFEQRVVFSITTVPGCYCIPESVPGLAEGFRGERPLSDTGAVRLYRPVDVGDLVTLHRIT